MPVGGRVAGKVGIYSSHHNGNVNRERIQWHKRRDHMDQHRHGDHDRGVDHDRALLHRAGEVAETARGLLHLLTHAPAALVGHLVLQAHDARRLLQPDDIERQAEGVLHHRLTRASGD
ncbi:uncharacterized protein LOC117217707 isoform X1 [Megalopta genalis]|uniref:uncharacterized protein LOC117217707 isoform X1 n=1 Tax=Megalopta genalis TaxID=115081 RepID=UPI003FD33285